MTACAHCGKTVKQPIGAINRALKIGAPIYCDKVCFGLDRSQHKTKEQKVQEKRQYDREYRRKNRALLKAKKRAYFQATYDPVKAAKARKARMHLHVQYCRQPAYVRWKRRYDAKYRAGRMFGPFAESFLLLRRLERVVANRATKYEIGLANGTINKAQLRRRAYASLISG